MDIYFQLSGYCVPRMDQRLANLAIVTEMGTKLDVLNFVQMPWTDRLSLVNQVVRFFERNSQIFTLTDLRRQQFVLAQNEKSISLIDLDDLLLTAENSEPAPYRAQTESAIGKPCSSCRKCRC